MNQACQQLFGSNIFINSQLAKFANPPSLGTQGIDFGLIYLVAHHALV